MPKNVAQTTRASNLHLHGADPFSELCPFTGELLRERDAALHFRFTTDASARGRCDQLGVKPANRMQAMAVDGIVTALMVEALGAGRAVSYSRNKMHPAYTVDARYRQDGFSYGPMMGAVELLEDAGLIDGWRAPAGTGPTGIQSTIWATPLLVELLAGAPILALPPVELVELRNGDKVPIPYRDTTATRRMRRQVQALNDLMGAASITHRDGQFHRPYLRRVFSETWDRHGRLYVSGNSYQNMPKGLRPSIHINGEATAEADYRSLHPTMAHIEVGAVMDGDPYEVPGVERGQCKVALNVAINAETPKQARGAVAFRWAFARAIDEKMSEGRSEASAKRYAREYGHPRRDELERANVLLSKVVEKHPLIAHAFGSGAGIRYMRKDSDMMLRTMETMARQGEPVLPMHDSGRVRVGAIGLLQEAMAEASKTVLGTEISTSVDLSSIPLN